jgi:hypothetical protein
MNREKYQLKEEWRYFSVLDVGTTENCGLG